MLSVVLVTALILAVGAQTTEETIEDRPGTYMISFVKKIRPGVNLDVEVNILSATSPVNLQINLVNVTDGKALDAGLLNTFNQGVSRIQYPIPGDLKRNSWRGYRLNFTATGGLTFNDSATLDFDSQNMSVFIQTDKAMYKPGQTVKFRIMAVDSLLKVLTLPMDVFIYDPQNNRIKQWLKKVGTAGLIEEEMVTSTEPLMGDWKIKVQANGQEEEITFTIAEYVLPKFEANLELPSFGFVNDTSITGKVTAKYTFGKPVTGSVKLVANLKYWRGWWRNDGTKPPQIVRSLMMKDGTVDFTLGMNEVKNLVVLNNPNSTYPYSLSWETLEVKANVTETITGNKMSAEGDLQFFDNPIKMNFMSNLPRTYKPGLKYTAILRVTRQDDSPILKPGKVKINVTYDVEKPRTTTTSTTTTPAPKTKEPSFIIPPTDTLEPFTPNRLQTIDLVGFPSYYYPTYDTKTLEAKFHDVGVDGFVKITVDVPSVAYRISLKAEGFETSSYLSASRSYSPSENYIQISMLTQSPKVGVSAAFELKSTEPLSSFTYQVLGRSKLITTKEITTTTPAILNTFFVNVTAEMAPDGKLIVYYKRPNGEIVADSISFSIQGLFENAITVDFDQAKVKPGAPVKLTIKGEPGSMVSLRTVDKSVDLLKSGNDITTDTVLKEVLQYGGNYYGGGDWFYCFWRWPRAGSGSDAASIFRNAGVALLTDAILYQKERNYNEYFRGGPVFQMASSSVVDDSSSGGQGAFSENNLAKVTRVRKFFPETWLWRTVPIGNTGQVVLQETAPDTVTTWTTSAFALHPFKGLSVANKTAKVTTFKDFFVSLNLPYSVIRNEVVLVQATVFNYFDRVVPAMVTLSQSSDFVSIKMQKYFVFGDFVQNEWHMTQRHFLGWMEPNSVRSTYFPIAVRQKIGDVLINVAVQSLYESDAVERNLLVEPEGIERSSNEPVLVRLDSTTKFKQSVTVRFPDNTVSMSQRVRINVAGDILGPSLNNIDKLLKMPYGCGEQNMLNFAPSIYVTKYLRKTGRLTTEIKKKATAIMEKGYQKELAYQHKDGSFSAFGDKHSNESGSMWLSAFVTKCFCQAVDMITIDENVIEKSILWMIFAQNRDGSFPEPGKVFNKRMQGGSGSGEALTAYVLIALKEAEQFLLEQGPMMTKTLEVVRLSIRSAQLYLEKQYMNITDAYDIAIVTYALQTTASEATLPAIVKMNQLATSADGVKYWKRPSPPEDANRYRYYWYRKNDAINIEATAYALLVITGTKQVNDGLPVLRWISNQRNPEGGFTSTQDTILAIEALSNYAGETYTPTTNLNIQVSWASGSKMFNVNSQNSLLLLSEDVNLSQTNIQQPMTFNIEGDGSGTALVEIATYYNVEQNAINPSFNLNTTVKNSLTDSFILEVCFSYQKSGNASMSVIEVGVPTGFEADISTLPELPNLSKHETGDRKLTLYFDQVSHDWTCMDIQMNMFDPVAKGQPVPVRIYDYYEPDDEYTMFYRRKEASVCEVCPGCGLCVQWRR
ncbi:CD109 antigen isoform X2 [Patella vulgata]|uniref:CD109 antigen isoform X2 n=1 Tax=Patella vulgata TaxID=6465 RepID=UPI0021804A3D|nr:CD109 antigen isoform X2 [Patella vulgata]